MNTLLLSTLIVIVSTLIVIVILCAYVLIPQLHISLKRQQHLKPLDQGL